MIDVRAVALVSPLREVEFASARLTFELRNFGDESVIITGLARVYSDASGLLIHETAIPTQQLAGGESVQVSALTDFDPPSPADDTYFVLGNFHAQNDLHPHGIDFFWPATYFDVKPVGMGPAPEAHHATHEDEGSDEIDLANISGLTADPQIPTAHASSHAVGGADELSHGDLEGLSDDDHHQYRLRHELFKYDDMLYASSSINQMLSPWYAPPYNSGTIAPITGSALHPGIGRISSSTSANSGARIYIDASQLILAGGEISLCWCRPQTLAGTTVHHGFHDANSVSDPVDGAWIWQDPATGIVYGRTMSNSIGSTTGTGYQLVTNTWYCEKIVVNTDATQVDFYVYAEDGTELWHDSLNTNIPTDPRSLGHGIIASNSGTSAVSLVDIDYLSLLIPDRRPNL